MSERVTSVSSSNVLSKASVAKSAPMPSRSGGSAGSTATAVTTDRKPAGTALPRIDREEHERGSIALRVELREERGGAREVRLELTAHVRVGQIGLVERQPPLGQRELHGRVADRALLPACRRGRSGARRRRFGPARHAAGKGNRPGEQRQGGSGPREVVECSGLDHDRARDEVHPTAAPLVDEDPDVADIEDGA